MTANPHAGGARPPGLGKRRLIASFRRSQDGAAAIEFGIVALPFLGLLLAIFELAMMFWTNEVLEESLSRASRRLLTGEAAGRYVSSDPTANAAAFRNDVCAETSMSTIDCAKLHVDVKVFSDFGSARNLGSPMNGGVLDTSGFGYVTPQPKQIAVVRVVLEYKLFFMGWAMPELVNIGADRRGLVASVAFRAEPYVAQAAGGSGT